MTFETGSHYPIRLSSLPAGWRAGFVGDFAKVIEPGFASGEHNRLGDGVPHLRPMNVDRDGKLDLTVIKSVAASKDSRRLVRGDVLFNNTNSPELVGKTAVIAREGDFAFSNHMTRIRFGEDVTPAFAALQLHYLWMRGYFKYNCVKHVNQASVSSGTLARMVPFVLAPEQEQRRIVAEIEKQFSRLDEAVANLQRVKANLARYRTATISAAVEGKLLTGFPGSTPDSDASAAAVLRQVVQRRTASWPGKYQPPIEPTPTEAVSLPTGWVWASISQLMSERIVNGLSVKESSEETEVRALRLNAMTSQGFDFSEFRHLPVEPSEVEDILIRAGDFFVSRGNGSLELVGRGTVAQTPPASFIFPDTMMRIRFTAVGPVLPWVAMLWPSRFIRKQIEARVKTTAGIYKIAQPQLASITFPFPPLAEQRRIVAEVDRRLSIVREVEAEVDANLKRAQALRQAVLSKTFHSP